MTRSRLRTTPARAALALLAITTLFTALAQDFTGTYTTQLEQGVITVELAMQGVEFSGYMQGPGIYLELEGWLEDGVGVGVATSAEGTWGFEAVVEGELLGLWFYEVVNGAVVPESEIEVILERVAGTAAPTVEAPAAPAVQAPAAPAVQAPPASEPGAPRKQIPGAPAAGQPASAGAAGALGAPPASQTGSPVVATGQFASLTQDDATAFIEALEFVLSQIGYAYTFTDAERTQAFQAIAQNFPYLTQAEQVVLSQARDIWERVSANWSQTSAADQQEFALGVLVLAFGEETVAQWAGTGSGGGGGGGCATFEDCTSSLVGGQAWSDTFNTQGCWAAAGCNGYDVGTGTFDYEGY